MMMVEKVETLLLDVPTIRPHVLAMATMKTQTIVLVRLYFSDGTVGIGEATTIGGLSYGPESPEGIKLTIDQYITPLLQNASFASVAATMHHLRKYIVGNHFALCAIETALLDAAGKRLGAPVSTLLGGAIQSTLSVGWVLASGQIEQDIAEAHQMLEGRRHNIFKVKIGKRPVEEDVAHVAAIKKALGSRASVRVDVNQAWSRTEAKRGCAMLHEAGIDLVEQPLRRDDVAGTAALKQGRTPALMLDETLHGPASAWQAAGQAACDVFALKIAPSGGLTNAAQVAHIGMAAGIELYGGTMLESSVGTAASAHLFATLPDLQWGTELFAPLLLTETLITEPLRYENFQLHVPIGPGLGIALDDDKLKYFSRT